MSEVLKVNNPGLLVPAKWLRNMGRKVTIRREGNVVLIESGQRAAARARLKRAVRSLRTAAKASGFSEKDVASEIASVRAPHAVEGARFRVIKPASFVAAFITPLKQ